MHHRLMILMSILALSLSVLTACGEDDDADEPANNEPAALTFDDVSPIFETSCAGGACHTDGGASGGLALDDLAGVKAGGENGAVVVAGNADGSTLFTKLTENPPFPSRMPLGAAPLGDSDMSKIQNWINSGTDLE